VDRLASSRKLAEQTRLSCKSLSARLALGLRGSPWLVTVLLVLGSCVVIRPWGNYALNDDWTYAHMARRFGEAWSLKIDVPLAPNGLLQAIVGGLVVRLFGFSHTVLRLLTLAVGFAGLHAVDRLLRCATERRSIRLIALVVLAFNPIYFYSFTTYMNELYGWVPALYAAVLWFWDRTRLEREGERMITPWVAVAVGLLAGSTFWTRQLCVLVFPALLVAAVVTAVVRGRVRALVLALPSLALACAVFGAVIWAFFVWAKATGNYRPEFAARVGNLFRTDAQTYRMQVGSALVYMTAFFLPCLALAKWKAKRMWLLDLGGALLVVVAIVAADLFETQASTDFWIGPIWHHKVFPFIVNIVYNAGLGPITLDDAFFRNVAKPSWPRGIWVGLEVVFIAVSALWAAVCAGVAQVARTTTRGPKLEVVLFAGALVVGSLLAIIQSHQGEMVDRYYLPLILGAAILVPGVLATTLPSPIPVHAHLRFAVLFGAIAIFSVFGAHDEFRWNDARWELIRTALEKGGTRATIQAGYEYNCWNKYEGLSAEEQRCAGGCRCEHTGFCCVDDRFQIGMSVSPGYKPIRSIQPSYWLASGPPVVLSKREPR
jgi:hypothetical protein